MAEEEEKREKEAEEEKHQRAEAMLKAEQMLRDQGWWMDKSLEEFWQCQWREEKGKEVDRSEKGDCLGCWARGMECV